MWCCPPAPRKILYNQFCRSESNKEADDVSPELAEPEDVVFWAFPIEVEQKRDLERADNYDRQADRHPSSRWIKGDESGEDPYKIRRKKREMGEEKQLFEGQRPIAFASAETESAVSVSRHWGCVRNEKDDDGNGGRKSAERDEKYE